MKTSFVRLAAVAAVTATAFAGNAIAADATGNASATVATPISISEGTALSFGTFLADTTTSSVTVSATGTRTHSAGATFLLGGTVNGATFNVTGEGTSSYSVSFTDGTLTGAGDNMAINTFTHNSGGALSGGTDSFNVGATLDIGANQAAGAYTGTYTVTVNYN